MTALVIAGAAVYLVLGFAHMSLTLASSSSGGPLASTRPEIRAAMDEPSGLGMAPRLDSTMWTAWVGFNLSHSLGVLAVAGTIMYHAISNLEAVADTAWFLVLTCGLPAIYLLISIRYWFARPTRGIAIGGVLLAVGTLGTVFG